MLIQCKTQGCPGHVDYQPKITIFTLFSKALDGEDKIMVEPLSNEKFHQAVKTIVKATDNNIKQTKTLYLTCDNAMTPHTNAYQVPTT